MVARDVRRCMDIVSLAVRWTVKVVGIRKWKVVKEMRMIIELSSLHAFLCTRDKQRAKQFKRMRRANLRARKKKAACAATQTAK